MSFTAAQLAKQSSCKLPHDGTQGTRIFDTQNQTDHMICTGCQKQIDVARHTFDAVAAKAPK
jgi:Fe2+ or Zn2+ uptake regulation protein